MLTSVGEGRAFFIRPTITLCILYFVFGYLGTLGTLGILVRYLGILEILGILGILGILDIWNILGILGIWVFEYLFSKITFQHRGLISLARSNKIFRISLTLIIFVLFVILRSL